MWLCGLSGDDIKTPQCLCESMWLCLLEGLCPFRHTLGISAIVLSVSVCLCVPHVSIHLYSSQVVGDQPELGIHAFSRTDDFYQNDNELMTQ